MQVLWQRWVGIACIVALVMVAMPMGHAGHEAAGTIHVANVAPADKGLRIGANDQAITFDVVNSHATADAEQITVTITGSETAKIAGASATGWTAIVSDGDTDGNDDTVTLTGKLAKDGTIRVTVLVDIPSSATEAQTLALAVTATDTTPTPDVDLGTDAIDSLTFWNSRIQISPSVVIIEEGAADNADRQQDVTVQLRTGYVPAQGASVQVAISVADLSIAQLVGAGTDGRVLLTFDDTNTPQTVTVTADDADDIDSGVRQTPLRARYASQPLAAGATIPIFVADDDQAAFQVTETDDATVVYEGSDADTFEVNLATPPTAPVNVSVTLGAPGQATVDKAVLRFDGSNWHTPQTVTVTAVDDAVEENLVTTSQITLALADDEERTDGYDEAETQVITLSIVDNDGAGIIVEQSDQFTQVTEAEGGRTDAVTVVLARAPLHDVIVDVVPGAASSADLSVLPTQLTFTPSNWLLPKSVAITAIDDNLGEGTEIASIEFRVNTARDSNEKRVSSPEYLNVPKQTVQVTIVDNDERGFAPTITSANKRTSETNGTASNNVRVQVELNVRPEANVTLDVVSSDTTEIRVLSGKKLTFTPDNWDDAQNVVLHGIDDDLRDGHQDINITFSVNADSHPIWRNLPDVNLTVTNRDNEHTVMVRPVSMQLAEGDAETYDVSLTLPPASGQTIKVLATPADGLALDAPTAIAQEGNDSRLLLSFSAADAPQTITVTALDDGVALGDRDLTVTHASTSGDDDYHNIPVDDLVVTVIDNERFDLASANEALQATVQVERRGGDNYVSWDIGAVAGDPIGVQVWRSDSPFVIIATLDNETPEYRDGEYRDRSGSRAGNYIVTVFYGHTSDQGRFPINTPLSIVPGYLGLSLAEQQALGISMPDEDGLSTGALVAIIVAGAVALLLIIVLIVVSARRSKEPEEDEDWDTPVEAWQPTSQVPAATAEESTYHLTCPRCSNDFDAVGHKPLVTHCPHCGVEGVLR